MNSLFSVFIHGACLIYPYLEFLNSFCLICEDLLRIYGDTAILSNVLRALLNIELLSDRHAKKNDSPSDLEDLFERIKVLVHPLRLHSASTIRRQAKDFLSHKIWDLDTDLQLQVISFSFYRTVSLFFLSSLAFSSLSSRFSLLSLSLSLLSSLSRSLSLSLSSLSSLSLSLLSLSLSLSRSLSFSSLFSLSSLLSLSLFSLVC